MHISVIGSGFAGLSAASYLAKAGYGVDLYEKNSTLGGRARKFTAEGFTFDMGPSWYWMPDVFEDYYRDFGYAVQDFYDLKQLDPGFRMYFGKDDYIDVPADIGEIRELFESLETGAAGKLDRFMAEAKKKYDISMSEFVQKPGLSVTEFFAPSVVKAGLSMNLLGSFGKYVRRMFKNPRLRALMDFPVLFLGASSEKTPALYSMMNYAGIYMGTWYPQGGMHEIIQAFTEIARKQGVTLHASSEIEAIDIKGRRAQGLVRDGQVLETDAVIAAGDYHHMETLLPKGYRNYDEPYWEKRVMSPSSLLFYLGVNKKLKGLEHHTLFFDQSLEKHSEQIYEQPQWPDEPLFYACCPSKTDKSVAPEGKENLFLLVPLAAGLEDTEELREEYYHKIMDRLESLTGQSIKDEICYKRSYAMKDFKQDYHAYKGNAYGLANTLSQTAVLKPKLINKKVDNLYYAGQLTVPGPGVPPSIISGRIAAKQLQKNPSLSFQAELQEKL